MLELICEETPDDNLDTKALGKAVDAIKKLQRVVQLWTFQSAMNQGESGLLEWHDLVSEEVRKALPKKEATRQS